jgi:hypothetical protein
MPSEGLRRFAAPALVAVLVAGHLLIAWQLQTRREGVIRQQETLSLLPVMVYKIVALEYQGLVADLVFSRTMSFYGGTLKRDERIDAETHRVIYQRLDTASQLDPYFVDPYVFGQSVLAWGAGMPTEANALLDRGRRHRTEDWLIPFLMGFNAFYFLHDKAQASEYLMESSQRPGASPAVGLLAARMASETGGTEIAVVFLQQLARQTDDEATRDSIRLRIDALQGIAVLEAAVREYHARFGALPATPGDLLSRGVVFQLPVDPYGGTYFIAPGGKVWTTSNLRPVKK